MPRIKPVQPADAALFPAATSRRHAHPAPTGAWTWEPALCGRQGSDEQSDFSRATRRGTAHLPSGALPDSLYDFSVLTAHTFFFDVRPVWMFLTASIAVAIE